jgi:molybdopterin/thiamine biosynthesis adenylyltransferase
MTPYELHVTEAEWQRLHAHHFGGELGEHGAVLLCGLASSGRAHRLLVRAVLLAHDGVDYVPGTRGYRHLTGEFVTDQIRRAKDEQLVYLAVHNHGYGTSVGFSQADFASHERGYPTLMGRTKRPVGGIVLADQAVAGDIWLPDGSRADLARTVIHGTKRVVLTPQPEQGGSATNALYQRQSLVFGDVGQRILGEAKVAVVGAGGVGMLVVQLLARLGVGHLVVVDPERVEPTNMSRLPEATRLDAMTFLDRDGIPGPIRRRARRLAATKVRVAHRLVRRANPNITFEGIVGDVADDDVAQRIVDCDFIFLAADTMLARTVVNQIAYQYLVPTLQVGSKAVIDKRTGGVRDVYAAVRTLGTAPGCLSCNGLIDPERLSEEALGDPVQLANQRYVDDPDVHAPSVVTINAMGAGWAANDFMHYMVGLRRPADGFRLLRTLPVHDGAMHVTVVEPEADPDCYVCGDHGARALGDGRELPTRERR